MNADGVGQTRLPGKEDSLLRERFSGAVADQNIRRAMHYRRLFQPSNPMQAKRNKRKEQVL